MVEAARSFGATSWQLLYKVQLPLALPTILAGVNQTIMMSLSMVVVAAMISAGGLGEIVLKGITQMKIGMGFEGGIAVVILAIVLDRITQGIARKNRRSRTYNERQNDYEKQNEIFHSLVAVTIFFSCGNISDKKIRIAYANWPKG